MKFRIWIVLLISFAIELVNFFYFEPAIDVDHSAGYSLVSSALYLSMGAIAPGWASFPRLVQ